MVHHEVGAKQVQNKKQDLIALKKLVLVLDLDNTLIHSKEVKAEDMKFKQHARTRHAYIELLDELRSVYEIRMNSCSSGFHVKLRPFLVHFFKYIHSLILSIERF